MKTLLMVLSLAFTFAMTAVQADDTNLLTTFQVEQTAVQDDGADCSATDESQASTQADENSPLAQTACCRTCTKGKACGDSCIARDKTCRRGRGCACNATKPI
ncbi:hypothetical protein B0I24_101257 [Aliidiomarina maris]|uniref:Metallothionein n=1 Tax=Aliidiomarina maris TaxID=531312 RepID=A0A327X6I6_9GAMM|nr:hypothetical protein B0I24_101257 [Aliidiomarina maris]